MSIIFVVIVAIDKINWHLCISTYKYGTVKKKKSKRMKFVNGINSTYPDRCVMPPQCFMPDEETNVEDTRDDDAMFMMRDVLC